LLCFAKRRLLGRFLGGGQIDVERTMTVLKLLPVTDSVTRAPEMVIFVEGVVLMVVVLWVCKQEHTEATNLLGCRSALDQAVFVGARLPRAASRASRPRFWN
jgi:hypothetical protein